MKIPEDLKYTKTHEWIKLDGETARVGITDHAQSELGEVVYVELPELERVVEAGEATVLVESVKAASEIYSPVSGEVVAVSGTVADDSSLINSEPYEEGWLFEVRLSDLAEIEALLDAEGYKEFVG